MSNIITKSRILDNKIRVYLSNRKKIKHQQYRRFLQNPNRQLPSYNQIKRMRNICFYTGILCMCIPCFQTVFFYHTIWVSPEPLEPYEEITLERFIEGFLNIIPFVFGFLFFMFSAFSAMFDWVIYRRWGNDKSFIDW